MDFVDTQLSVVLLQSDDGVPTSEESRSGKSGGRPSGKLPEFLRNGKSGSLAAGEKALPSYGRANGTRQSRRIRDNWTSLRVRYIDVRKTSTLKDVKQAVCISELSNEVPIKFIY